MLVPIGNTPRPYAWGSTTAIAELLGHPGSGAPEAELWLGATEGSPSVILDPSLTGGATDLAVWIAADPVTTLGRFAPGGRLPFLLKVLAASSPLSLQAHPTSVQAAEGFARENAAGVPIDSPDRNYKDAYPKPELIYALSDPFDALCGFRPTDEVLAIVGALRDAASADTSPLDTLLERLDVGLPDTVGWLLSGGPAVEALVALVVRLAHTAAGWPLEFETVRTLAAEYPGDPGIVMSLLLNRVRLQPGEALYLAAGNIHAYLRGVGVELMTASDNVLRGGLTPKHVDVPELLSVLDCRAVPVPYLLPTSPGLNLEVFRPEVPDFVLVRVDGDATWPIDGPAIVICTAGEFTVNGTPCRRGEALYATPNEATLRVAGAGTLFVAAPGR